MLLDILTTFALATLFAGALAAGIGWRAPARRNTRLRAFLGFLLPAALTVWAAREWMTPAGRDTWGAIWLPIGLVTLVGAFLVATVAAPDAPTRRERRRARRRGELLDPVFVLYSFAMLTAVLAAIVTHHAWA